MHNAALFFNFAFLILIEPMLEIKNLTVGYGAISALHGISLSVPAGSIVAFDSYVLHRSGPNTTARMRRVYLPQYSAEPICRPDGRPRTLAVPFLKDGKMAYNHAEDRPENFGPFPAQVGG